ncbi:MAG TPA: hypothetical protein VFI02_21460 [Armatimonadota bacterium]|nr:hypothetical protein [Armatimonadota bacterium]
MRTAIPALILLIAVVPAHAAITIAAEKCEELYSKLPKDDPWLKTQDGSSLAWGEAGVIHAILDLYEATGDTKYLKEVVRRGDRMLSHRDDVRGFKDWSGKAHKAWSMAIKYTVAEGALMDTSGKPVVRLRSTPYAYNNQTKVEVTAQDDSFSLKTTNAYWKREETFANLSTDPASPRYFERIINDPTPTPSPDSSSEDSQLLKVIPIGKGTPKTQSLTLQSLPLAYSGYIGIIYYPLLRLAEMVRADDSLKEFQPPADRFIKAADESYTEYQDHFRNGPGKDEGYYITCKRGGPFPYDDLPEPFNYLGCHVSSEIALYRLTGKPVYKEHAERMANLFKNRLKLMPGDLYVWNYWYEPLTSGYSSADDLCDNYPQMAPKPVVEDNSHGTLDILLVMNAADAGIAFDEKDLRRFANTFLRNLVRPDYSGLNGRIDGTPASGKYVRTGITGWLPLTQADPAVYEACRKIYINRGVDSFTALARLLKWEKKLGK